MTQRRYLTTLIGVVATFTLLLAIIVGFGAAQDGGIDAPVGLDDLAARDVPRTGSREGDALRALLVESAPEAVRRGGALFDANCSVCHGDTGLGLEEARLSFPADHRACERCHRPGNPREMSFAVIMERQHDLFDVWVLPALRGPNALGAFATSDEALFAYLRATMPRYQPGRLSDAEYRDLVAFVRWIAPIGGAPIAQP